MTALDVQELNNKVIRLETREQYTNKSLANLELHVEELRKGIEKNGLASDETNAGLTSVINSLDRLEEANKKHTAEHEQINKRLTDLERAPEKEDAGKWRKWQDKLQMGISWVVTAYFVGKLLSWVAKNILEV